MYRYCRLENIKQSKNEIEFSLILNIKLAVTLTGTFYENKRLAKYVRRSYSSHALTRRALPPKGSRIKTKPNKKLNHCLSINRPGRTFN